MFEREGVEVGEREANDGKKTRTKLAPFSLFSPLSPTLTELRDASATLPERRGHRLGAGEGAGGERRGRCIDRWWSRSCCCGCRRCRGRGAGSNRGTRGSSSSSCCCCCSSSPRRRRRRGDGRARCGHERGSKRKRKVKGENLSLTKQKKRKRAALLADAPSTSPFRAPNLLSPSLRYDELSVGQPGGRHM